MKTKGHTVNNIPQETLDLLKDARSRAEKESGYPVPFQAFLRKILQDVADDERKLQDAASEEYAKQASEDART